MKKTPAILLLPLLLLSACETRSISDTGSRTTYYGGGYSSLGVSYSDMTEMDVLGVDFQTQISEEDIARAIGNNQVFALHPGSRVLLVQSGAKQPDGELMQAVGAHFEVVPISGTVKRVSSAKSTEIVGTYGENSTISISPEASVEKALRYCAARAGADTVIVVWGVLESEVKPYATKVVSWVPIVGDMFPDEAQGMRIRLRAAVIDVASGSWKMLLPEVFQSEETSSGNSRTYKDTKQILELKARAYSSLAELLSNGK